jgi:rhomboid family GlyGly-CTERM serine protease
VGGAVETFVKATGFLLAICAVGYLSPPLSSLLEYNRDAVAAGERWRLWTGSLVHFGGSHLFWNVLLVAALGAWLEQRRPWTVRAYYLLCPLFIGAALWIGDSAPETYRGLSGVGAGLVVLAAGQAYDMGKRRAAWVILALLGASLVWEQLARPSATWVTYDRAEVVTWSHAHLVGAAWAAFLLVLRRASISRGATSRQGSVSG